MGMATRAIIVDWLCLVRVIFALPDLAASRHLCDRQATSN